jgi:hypothetical protein
LANNNVLDENTVLYSKARSQEAAAFLLPKRPRNELRGGTKMGKPVRAESSECADMEAVVQQFRSATPPSIEV